MPDLQYQLGGLSQPASRAAVHVHGSDALSATGRLKWQGQAEGPLQDRSQEHEADPAQA